MTLGSHRAALVLLLFVAACSNKDASIVPVSTPPPTTQPARDATLADLSAAVTSTEADTQIGCTDDLRAKVTLTNHAPSSVRVLGVRMVGNAGGGCTAAEDFTYRPDRTFVAASSTGVVLDQVLFTGPTGCCEDPKDCGGTCDFSQGFDVITPVGAVPAGSFNYKIKFTSRCPACDFASASGGRCRVSRLRRAS